jgi:glutamine synthetase
LPDPSCNPYVAIAATLAAGLDGLDQALSAPDPVDEDLYERRAAGGAMPPRLPRSLDEAVTALECNAHLRELLGHAFCEEFTRLKRMEWDSFHLHVSQWELNRYADAF